MVTGTAGTVGTAGVGKGTIPMLFPKSQSAATPRNEGNNMFAP